MKKLDVVIFECLNDKIIMFYDADWRCIRYFNFQEVIKHMYIQLNNSVKCEFKYLFLADLWDY